VALVVFFWVSTANTIDEAKEIALAKPALDLVDRERLVVSPEIDGTDLTLLIPLPDLVFDGTGVFLNRQRHRRPRHQVSTPTHSEGWHTPRL
tara:strand:- start:223 stop:498 length:276 start_codon:yes stop_codon:yes gene_type:complete